jgi:adenosylhomocysteinase
MPTGKLNELFNELSTKGFENFYLKQTSLILIHHLLPTHTEFFCFLNNFFDKTILIAIPYSVNFAAKKNLENISNIKIEIPASINQTVKILDNAIENELLEPSRKIVIIEIGGYSTQILTKKRAHLKSKILCVIEDTENGLRLHQKCLENKTMWWPLFSVARSPLKLPEDNLTADAVLFSLEKIIRTSFNVLIAKNVLVIGFGKIGKSICQSLKNRKNIVYVYDSDPIKLIEAYSAGYQIRSKLDLFQLADIIIGATGNQSVTKEDFANLKDGVYLCSASSKQVEFDINFLERTKKAKEKVADNVDAYILEQEKKVFLIKDGTPVNFIDYGIIGNVLQLVWLEIIFCLYEVSEKKKLKGIHELDINKRLIIAKTWLKVYKQLEDD